MNSEQACVDILFEELKRAKEKNPRYSLRALSKALGYSPAYLSLVLSGKKKPSRALIQTTTSRFREHNKIAKKLFMSAGKAPVDASLSPAQLKEILDGFDWTHHAVLSLLSLRSFQPTAPWMAARLGIDRPIARKTWLDLIRSGHVRKKSNGKWEQTHPPLRYSNRQATRQTLQINQILLEKARHALTDIDFDERILTSQLVPIARDQVSHALEILRETKLKLAQALTNGAASSDIYCLHLSLFPITEKEKT